jgi:hypothetical protein
MNDQYFDARRLDRIGIFRTAVNPLRCAVPAARKPGVAIHGHPRDACVAPLEAAGKTCDAMLSCIAASRGSPSLATPLGACAEPCFSRSGKYLSDRAFSNILAIQG